MNGKTIKFAISVVCPFVVALASMSAAQADTATAAVTPFAAAPVERRAIEGDAEKEIAALHNVLRADPKNYDAQLKLGDIYLRTNEPAEAIKQYTAALPSSDHAARAKQGLGLAFLRLGDPTTAQRYLSEALAADAELWLAQLGMAEIADRTRDWEAAEKAYQEAIRLSPGEPAVYNNLGLSYTRQRRYDDAVAQFQKSLSLRADPAVRANLRFAYAMKGEYLTALAGVAKENMADALNNVGYAAMLRGDYDVAEAYLTRAVEARASYHAQAADNLQLLKDLRQAKLARATTHR